MTAGVLELDDLAGDWLDRDDIVHLPSLRNQWGQAHVNPDLTSMSWLAIPPYTCGYHTGVLRIDGRVCAAQRFRWSPWGVDRQSTSDDLVVISSVSMGYEATSALWRIQVSNASKRPRALEVEQELLAAVAHSEVDWGWTYGTPWSRGQYHDFHATERVRAETVAQDPREAQLLPSGARPIRLGSPRPPGIQRDEDGDAMLIESALPDHSTPDVERNRPAAILGTVAEVRLVEPRGEAFSCGGPYVLDALDAECRLQPVRIAAGGSLDIDLVLADTDQTGVILTHGNHPDSLQVGLRSGRPWLSVGGEHVESPDAIDAGETRISIRFDDKRVSLHVDGTEVATTSEWWRSGRWSAVVDRGAVLIADAQSPACAAYAVSPAPSQLDVADGRGVAHWRLSIGAGETRVVWVALELGVDREQVVAGARAAARDPETALGAVADRWRRLWRNAFTPGNDDHSGYLPVFESERSGLARTYYTGILPRSICGTPVSARSGRSSLPVGRGSGQRPRSFGTSRNGPGQRRCSSLPACAPGSWQPSASPMAARIRSIRGTSCRSATATPRMTTRCSAPFSRTSV